MPPGSPIFGGAIIQQWLDSHLRQGKRDVIHSTVHIILKPAIISANYELSWLKFIKVDAYN